MNSDPSSGSGHALIKRLNQTRILGLLYSQESASRAQLARSLGLTRSALSKHVSRLLDSGLVIETEEKDNAERTGRPGVVLRLNRRENYFFGVEIGGQLLRVIALDFEARLVSQRHVEFEIGAEPRTVVSLLKSVIAAMVLEEKLNPERARGIGVSVSGLVTKAGKVLYSPAMGWRDVPILELVQNELGAFAEAALFNDANASAFGEAYAARRLDEAELAFMLVDVGVGIGVLTGGRIFAGADGFAGELGPVRLHLPNAPGHVPALSFEAAVARHGLVALVNAQGLTCQSLAEVLEHLARSDLRALAAVRQWGDWLVEGLLTLTLMYDPRQIYLGGQGVAPARWIMEEISLRFQARLQEVRSGYPAPELRFSDLGEAAAAIGSACFLHAKLFSVSSLLTGRAGDT